MRLTQPLRFLAAAFAFAAVVSAGSRRGEAGPAGGIPMIVELAPRPDDLGDPRRLDGMIAGPTFTSDGATWYVQTLTSRPRLIRLDADGTVRAFPLPPYASTGLTAEGTSVAYAPPSALPILTRPGDFYLRPRRTGRPSGAADDSVSTRRRTSCVSGTRTSDVAC